MERERKSIGAILLALLMCVMILISGQGSLSAYSAYAAERNVETSSVEDDLKAAGLDLTLYGKNPTSDASLIYFTEYCYSEREDVKDLYGLYLYVYNPRQTSLETKSGLHKANMAVSYIDGEAVKYENTTLIYLDSTDDWRFVKFKVLNPRTFYNTAYSYAYQNDGVRRYDVASVQLVPAGGGLAVDFGVGATFTFSGFAAGCDADGSETSTLKMTNFGFDVLNLDIEHTTWRSPIVDGTVFDERQNIWTAGTQESVTTAYFGVPEEYIDRYAALQKIAAEWYEYKTKPIFVTSDGGAFNELQPWINVNVGEGNNDLTRRVLWERETLMTSSTSFIDYYYKAFNGKKKGDDGNYKDMFYSNDTFGNGWSYVDTINWLFRVSENPTSLSDYNISVQQMEDYMTWYTKAFPNESKVLERYAHSLFTDSIDEDRIGNLVDQNANCGYVRQEIDVRDDKIADLKIADDRSDWDKFWGLGDVTTKTFDPIVVLDDSISMMDEATFEKTYIVNSKNCSSGSIFEDCKKMLRNGMRPVLFRFAVTDYYTSIAVFDNTDYYYGDTSSSPYMGEPDGYVAQETVFLNFDILSLTFLNKDGKTMTVIPVAASPIDIVPGVEPPPNMPTDNDGFDWWSILFIALVVIAILIFFPQIISLVLSLIVWVCGVLLKGVGWILSLPVKLVKKIKNKKNRGPKR